MANKWILFCAILLSLTVWLFTAPSAFAAMARVPLADGPALAIPPLPGGGCREVGTPIDYDTPVCCVGGYVYVEGQPVAGATIIVRANGQTLGPVTTAIDAEGQGPYFTVGLDRAALQVKPGDGVTLTATFNGQTQSVHFIAQPGGQQIDVVIPTPKVDSTWLAASIGARRDHAMAYDTTRQQVVLFGGATDRDPALADTWLWDGTQWTEQRPSTRPPARYGHALAYDSARQQVVLFGGQDQHRTYLQDLWVWDGANWVELPTTSAPGGRVHPALAYDPVRQQIVLFGGANGSGSLNDTWVWDGVGWTEIKPANAPSKRLKHALAYAATSQRMWLYGGQTDAEHPDQTLADTWTWDGINWTPVTPATSPPALTGHALAYDAARQQLLLFGGATSSGADSAATWVWNGTDWSLRAPVVSPPARQATSLVYDGARQQILLFAGFSQNNLYDPDRADTWTWDGNNWRELAPVAPFSRWQGVGVAYADGGRYLLFGGLAGNVLGGVPQSTTFAWQSDQWTRLTPMTTPAARYGQRLARSQAGNRLLMFGGLIEDIFYLGDTWLWQENNWTQVLPAHAPSPRADYGLTYDSARGVWVLFGGRDDAGVRNDLWEFNGTDWVERPTPTQPGARRLATLTYDPLRKRSVLFGGRDADTYLDDVWEWDGQTWQLITPPLKPAARAGHGAAYDPDRQVVVMAGGGGTNGALLDTWTWNGLRWQLRTSDPALPALYGLTLDYDAVNQQMTAFGERVGSNLAGEGIWVHKVLTDVYDALPVATISHANLRDGRQGIDTFVLTGRGADGDATDNIVGYLWAHNGITLSTTITLTLPASALPLGEQTITFAVQDNEGQWSTPITQTIFVRAGDTGALATNQPTWTLLIYAVGDNNLAARLGDNPLTNGLLYRLRTAGLQPGVRVGVLYDGAGDDDTRRYILTEAGDWQVEGVPEADMGDMATLRDFVRWGVARLDSDYVALALVDHANGLVGFGQDQQGGGQVASLLTPIELRTALQAASVESGRKLDVLQIDGSSFGLLENAAIGDDLVNFMVVSPNTIWSLYAYDRYRRLAGNAANPRAYAQAVAQLYAESAAVRSLPYTISVFDLAHFHALQTAVGNLGESLIHCLANPLTAACAHLQTVRPTLQQYDSGGALPQQLDATDFYVDLLDLAQVLQVEIQDPGVQTAAAAVATQVETFVIEHKSASGAFLLAGVPVQIGFKPIGGVGIFYPLGASNQPTSTYTAYIEHRLFHITKDWGWTHFISSDGIPKLPIVPSPSAADMLLEPWIAEDDRIYLPLIVN